MSVIEPTEIHLHSRIERRWDHMADHLIVRKDWKTEDMISGW
jgi:hypothetical protein